VSPSPSERLRAEFIAGAEEESRRRLGRGLTREELERVLRRYPGATSQRTGAERARTTDDDRIRAFGAG